MLNEIFEYEHCDPDYFPASEQPKDDSPLIDARCDSPTCTESARDTLTTLKKAGWDFKRTTQWCPAHWC